MKKTAFTLAFLVAWMFMTPMGWAQNPGDAEHAELAKALRDAKIPLQRGLTASMKEGKPISAKYDAQSEAMAKAKRSLEAAASEAAKENTGYRVVSVMPAVKDGHPVADVTLVKGSDWKNVSEKLD